MTRARIVGIGAYAPKRILTNKDLEKMVDTSDEWITTRTGIKERRIAGEGEYLSLFATDAARKALDMSGVKAEEIYWLEKDKFQSHHGGFVKVGDYIYGGHNHNKGEPTCLEMKTGNILWHADQPGKGSGCVLYADGRLYFRYENGLVALVEATPEKYNLISTFTPPERPGATGTAWPYPVVSDGKLYLRHADVLRQRERALPVEQIEHFDDGNALKQSTECHGTVCAAKESGGRPATLLLASTAARCMFPSSRFCLRRGAAPPPHPSRSPVHPVLRPSAGSSPVGWRGRGHPEPPPVLRAGHRRCRSR